MNCKNIQSITEEQTQCSLTGCMNPQPDFCTYACPLVLGQKAEDSLDAYKLNKHGLKQGEKRTVAKKETVATKATLIQMFSLFCDACEDRNSCKKYDSTTQHRKWGSCCMNSFDKFKDICPMGKFTKELFDKFSR